MNKKITGIVLIFFSTIGFIYLIASFVALSFNPVQWDTVGRIIFGIFAPVMGIIVAGCAIDSEVFD